MDNYNYDVNNQNNDNNPDNNRSQASQNQSPRRVKDNLATLSLVFGIAALFSSMIFYVSIPCAITAIVLSILSRSRKGRFEGMAIAGLILGITGLALCLMMFALMLSMIKNPDLVNYLEQYYSITQ